MKFVVAALVLALALGAQSSYLPWGHLGLPYAAVHGHGLVAAAVPGHFAAPGISLHQGPYYGAHVAAPAAVAVHAAPAVHAHAALVAPAPVHGGTYVAKTRGAAHVAPLPGHIASASSINLQPAPGTW